MVQAHPDFPDLTHVVGRVNQLTAQERQTLAEVAWKPATLLPDDPTPEIRNWLSDVTFRDWQFHVRLDGTRPYLQIESPDDGGWTGRKWFLSPHMTRSEVVQTAFKAVMTALEHEAREAFRSRGCAVYSPHYDVERLVELHESGAALEVRADS